MLSKGVYLPFTLLTTHTSLCLHTHTNEVGRLVTCFVHLWPLSLQRYFRHFLALAGPYNLQSGSLQEACPYPYEDCCRTTDQDSLLLCSQATSHTHSLFTRVLPHLLLPSSLSFGKWFHPPQMGLLGHPLGGNQAPFLSFNPVSVYVEPGFLPISWVMAPHWFLCLTGFCCAFGLYP